MPPSSRSTPSHDAAQTLVSFHQNCPSSEVPERGGESPVGMRRRPIAFANAMRPPQNRRRVWRACEFCRKKKVKCDGSDPCQSCFDSGIECVYEVDGFRRALPDTQLLDSYGKRLKALEDLVTTLVDEQHRLAAQLACHKQGSESQDKVFGHATNHEVIPISLLLPREPNLLQPGDIHVDQGQNLAAVSDSLIGSVSVGTIEPELVSPIGQCQTSVLDGSKGPVENILDTVPQDKEEEVRAPTVYADDYGCLITEGKDHSRYFGLGATVWMFDDCPGIRARLQQGQIQKHTPRLEAPIEGIVSLTCSQNLPPAALMDVSIDTFFRKVYRLFPIIEAEDFQHQFLVLRSQGSTRPGFLALLYSVLAVSSPHISPNDLVWARPGCSAYKCLDLGEHFYSLAVAAIESHIQPTPVTLSSKSGPEINTVTALTLLGMHLTQLGMLNEAWRTIGHAVRLGYEMGLHRSPKRIGLPVLDVRQRCQLWWCLYVMDRLLAVHLGRPLAIQEVDSDVVFPSARPQTPGFVAMTHLSHLLGRIHQTVNAIEHARKWKNETYESELEVVVNDLWQDLKAWRENTFPSVVVEDFGDDPRFTERCVLFSSYCSAVHLLFRPFMATPHRPSRLAGNLARTESFRVAVECVEATEAFLRHVPVCHYYTLHGQNLAVSIATLLQCRLQAGDGDEHTPEEAHEQSNLGMHFLPQMEDTWPMARHHISILEGYRTLAQGLLHQGSSKRCPCDDGCPAAPRDETSLDPWQGFAAQVDQVSNLFPSMPDAAWMNELFHLSPSKSPNIVDCPIQSPVGNYAIDSERPSKRRRTRICTFTIRRK